MKPTLPKSFTRIRFALFLIVATVLTAFASSNGPELYWVGPPNGTWATKIFWALDPDGIDAGYGPPGAESVCILQNFPGPINVGADINVNAIIVKNGYVGNPILTSAGSYTITASTISIESIVGSWRSFGTVNVEELKISGAAASFDLNGHDLNVAGSINLDGGTLDIGDSTINVSSSIYAAAGSYLQANTGNLNFVGTKPAIYRNNSDPAAIIGNVTLAKTGPANDNTLLLLSTMTCTTLAVSADNTLDLGPNGNFVNGNCTVNAGGTVILSGTESTLNGDITLNGAMTVGGGKTLYMKGPNRNMTIGPTGSLSGAGTFRYYDDDAAALGLNLASAGSIAIQDFYYDMRVDFGSWLIYPATFGNGSVATNLHIRSSGDNLAYFSLVPGSLVIKGDLIFEGDPAQLSVQQDAGGPTDITLGGSWKSSGPGISQYLSGTETVYFDKGSGEQTVDGYIGQFNDFVHNGAGTLKIINELTVGGNFSQTAGTLNPNGCLIEFFKDVSFSAATGFNTATSNAVLFTGTTPGNYTDGNAVPLNIGQVILNKNNGSAANNILVLQSSMTCATLTVNANTTFNMGPNGSVLTLANDGSAANVLTVNGMFNRGTNSTVRFSAVNSGGSVNVPALPYHSLRLSGADETYVLANNLSGASGITGDIIIDSNATLDTSLLGSYTIQLLGNWHNAGTFVPNTGFVWFKGGSDQNVYSGGTGAGKNFNSISHTGLGILRFEDNTVVNSGYSTASGGEVIAAGKSLELKSNLYANADANFAGAVLMTGAGTRIWGNGKIAVSSIAVNGSVNVETDVTISDYLSIGGTLSINSNTLTVGGKWINNGTFSAGASTVAFNGVAAQYITAGGTDTTKAFHVVQLNNALPTGIIFDGPAACMKMQVLSSGATIYFTAGSTFVVTGKLDINGQSDHPTVLRSTQDGSRYLWEIAGSPDVSYVDVKDCDASPGTVINAAKNTTNVNRGNNRKWQWGVTGLVLSLAGRTPNSLDWSWAGDLAENNGYNMYRPPSGTPFNSTGPDERTWTEPSLSENSYYECYVRRIEPGNNLSEASATAGYYTALQNPAAPEPYMIGITSISVMALNVVHISSGNTGAVFSNTQDLQTSNWLPNGSSWTCAGLNPDTEYSFTAKLRNGDGCETTVSAAVSTCTRANVPGTPSITDLQSYSFKVGISANSNPARTLYAVEITTPGGPGQFVQGDGSLDPLPVYLTAAQWAAVTVTDLDASVQYSVRVRAKNGYGILTEFSASASATTPVPPRPEEVVGLRVSDLADGSITLQFSPVTRRINGDPLGTDFKEYAVYRSTGPQGPWNFRSTTTLTEYTDAFGSGSFSYKVTARDRGGIESMGTMLADTGQNIMVISEDAAARVLFDNDSKEQLYRGSNDLGQDVELVIEKATGEDPGGLCAYRFTAKNKSSGQALADDYFANSRWIPTVIVEYGAGANAIRRAGPAAGREPVLYWKNSVKWVKVSGTPDATAGTISMKTRMLGLYSVRSAQRSDTFTLTSVQPKIFSPDETNLTVSKARFYFENPNGSAISSKILDIQGRLVRMSLPAEGDNALFWDGKDDNGTIASSGVYLYEIEADGKIVNGTVVLAR